MHLLQIVLICTFGWTNVLTLDVPAPEYRITDSRLVVEDCAYFNTPGVPNIPSKKITIALPPGAIVESVDFHGVRREIGTCDIAPAQPILPLMDEHAAIKSIQELYKGKKNTYYTSDKLYPETYGVLLSKGGIRKYTIIDIACYHFAYRALSRKLFYAPNINVEIHYRVPVAGSKREQFWQGLIDDVTFDEIAQELLYNWEDARVWYHTDSPKRANCYYFIVPSFLSVSIDTLVKYRQNQGYQVQVVTIEYIESNVPGDDIQQKIRNFLRGELSGIEYVLLVGLAADTPWRQMVPFNNDPDSPWDDLNISPIPSDLYYAELTDPDSLSWNSDRDSYYGEVYDEYGQPNGEDNPDYHADIHVGRIPFSSQSVVKEICEKTIAFDCNTDLSYKTASLLAGGIYYFANENNGGNPRNDGADYMEQLLSDSVLQRSNAVYLYEKAGLRACPYPCTDSLTRGNMISYWQSKGIMYECHHGNFNIYARKIWAWDDGDSIPENNEMQWPTCLYITDVYQLDNDHPATAFLRSCLCGKPEVTSLAAQLLHYGSSAIISSSRIAWMTYADPGGMPYHFFDRLMKDNSLSNGIIGKAYDIARNDFMDATGFWLPAYHYNLFGDPALRQFGELVGVEEDVKDHRHKTRDLRLTASPNPFSDKIVIEFKGLGVQEFNSQLMGGEKGEGVWV